MPWATGNPLLEGARASSAQRLAHATLLDGLHGPEPVYSGTALGGPLDRYLRDRWQFVVQRKDHLVQYLSRPPGGDGGRLNPHRPGVGARPTGSGWSSTGTSVDQPSAAVESMSSASTKTARRTTRRRPGSSEIACCAARVSWRQTCEASSRSSTAPLNSSTSSTPRAWPICCQTGPSLRHCVRPMHSSPRVASSW